VQDDIAHDNSDHRSAIRRELHYFTLYRILEAALLCLVVFSPVGLLIGKPDAPTLARVVGLGLSGCSSPGAAATCANTCWSASSWTSPRRCWRCMPCPRPAPALQ
jgi:hypothetical protein